MAEIESNSKDKKTDLIDPKSVQEVERERLRHFPDIPDSPSAEDQISFGVLLSDQITRLVKNYKMIYPFDEESLKAASYELRVGAQYGRAGIKYPLADTETLTIQPFDVVLIQTLETLNLPRFLIARWNIRIKWAYKGLLWVGAPQVDPGFRGYLSCPLYNLSSKPVGLKFGEQFAAMDFVRTTEVTQESKPYKWYGRTRMVFEDYEKDGLESALITKTERQLEEMGAVTRDHSSRIDDLTELITETQQAVEANLNGIEEKVKNTTEDIKRQTENNTQNTQSRLDSYTSTTFTVIAFLFAALGLAVTKSPEFSFWSTSAPLAAIALWFALRAFYLTHSNSVRGRIPRFWFEIGSGVVLALAFLVFQFISINRHYAEWTTARDSAVEAKHAVEDLRTQISISKDLQQRVDSLQLQLDNIRVQLPKLRTNLPK